MSTQNLHMDDITALFILPKLGSNQVVLQEVNEKINCGTSRRWNSIQH